VFVDEWQRLGEVRDHVRHVVDAGSPLGHFIVAGGSGAPWRVVHSGAGRIVPMRMRPLSVAERGIEMQTVSLGALLRGNRDVGGATALRLTDYVEEITASGFPGIRGLRPCVRRAELDAYLNNVVQREFPEQGYPVRRPAVLRLARCLRRRDIDNDGLFEDSRRGRRRAGEQASQADHARLPRRPVVPVAT
jgi:uncharacterized protein